MKLCLSHVFIISLLPTIYTNSFSIDVCRRSLSQIDFDDYIVAHHLMVGLKKYINNSYFIINVTLSTVGIMAKYRSLIATFKINASLSTVGIMAKCRSLIATS